MRVGGRGLDDGLVFGRQAVEGLLVDEQVDLRTALPPGRIGVVRRDLVEAELLVVVGTDPLGRVDGALLQRLVDLAAGNVLRHAAQTLDHLAGEAADAELQALHVGDRLQRLAVPAAHLRAGVAAREADDAVLRVELAHQLQAVALEHPRGHLAAVHAEGNGRAQREGLVLAEEVVRHGVGALDGAVLHAIDHAEGGHQLAARMHRDLELAARHLGDLLREDIAAAVDGVERLREARGQAPADVGLRVHHGRRSAGSQNAGQAGMTNEGATLHADES